MDFIYRLGALEVSNLASKCLKHLSNILFGLVVSEAPSGHWRGTSPSPWITLPEASSGLFEAVKFPPVKRGKDKHSEKPMKTLNNNSWNWAKLKSGFLQVFSGNPWRCWCPSGAQLPSEVITTKDSGVTSDLELGVATARVRIAKQMMAA